MRAERAQKLDEILAEIRGIREKTLRLLEGITSEEAARRPEGGGWSLGEVAHHLVLAEEFMRGQVLAILREHAEGKIALEPSGLPERGPDFFESIADLSKIPPVKAPEALIPTHGLDFNELLSPLRSLPGETAGLLAEFKDVDMDRLSFQHPVLGKLSLYERIRFIGYHELRHHAQIRALCP